MIKRSAVFVSVLILGALSLSRPELVLDCAAADDAVQQDSTFFPQTELFPPLIADQREYIFSMRYERRTQKGRTFSAADASLGDSFPLKDFDLTSDSKLQFTFDGVAYALYDLNSQSDDLINLDFLAGGSAVYRNDDLSIRLRVRHKSSHLGDEYLLNHPGVERDNLSFEEVRLLPAYDWNGWRIYGGGGSIFRSNDSVDPLSLQGGLEYVLPTAHPGVAFFFASDFQSEARADWRLNQSYRSGIALGKQNARLVRFSFEYANGYAQEGQFTSESSEYYGFAIYFQL